MLLSYLRSSDLMQPEGTRDSKYQKQTPFHKISSFTFLNLSVYLQVFLHFLLLNTCPSHSNVERATHCQLAIKNKSIGSNIVMIVCAAPELLERPIFVVNAGPSHDKQLVIY